MTTVKPENWNIYHLLYGPALVISGLVTTATLGFVLLQLHIHVAFMIARRDMRKRNEQRAID